MFCHLPLPYPDELLYSVIARYLIYIGAKNSYSAANHIFGRETRAQVDLPSSLDAVSERTWHLWSMSGEEIAKQLTLFPYYARYIPKERAIQCLKTLMGNNGHGIHYRLGINSLRIKAPMFLRFCETCRKSDIAKYGETYWHRSHQLAGVLVCPEHGDRLIDTHVPMRSKGLSDYIDATMSTRALTSPAEDALGKLEMLNAQKIAKRCKGILMGPIEHWDIEDISKAYRQAAIERGFVEGALSLSQSKLESAFVSFYGESLLSQMGCAVYQDKKSNWLRNIFRAYPRTYHPLEHALVQIFLENFSVHSSAKIPFGFGPWKCPNPYAKHKEQFPITNPKIYIGNNGALVASAKCSCGFNFTFLQTSDIDPHLPIVNRTSGFGPTWEAEAQRLKRRGLSIRSIAGEMGIDRETVRNLLNSKSALYYVSRKQIYELRREWTKLLDSVPNRSRVFARKKNPKLYQKIRRNDREWLSALPKNKNSNFLREGKVDWASRDDKWSGMLRAAAQKVKEALPVKRLTPLAICVESGLRSTTLANLGRLPKCRLVFDECSESLEDCHERRLIAAADKAREMGKPLKPWVLKRLASLEGKPLSHRLTATLQSLISGINN